MDPLTEMYAGRSPYEYVFSNPVKLIDPTGMGAEDWVEKNGKLYYDSRVVDQKTAEKYWGQDAQYRSEGYGMYNENEKYIYLENNKGNFIIDGQMYQAYDYGNPSKSQKVVNWGLDIASSVLEGAQTVGYIFKGGFYDLPKQAIEEGRADYLKVDMDIVRYGFKNGEFVKNTFSSDRTMTDSEQYDAFVKPSVDALTAPVSFGLKPTSIENINRVVNFGVKLITKEVFDKLTRPEGKKK